MRADEAPLTAEERATLDAIETALAQSPSATSTTGTEVGNLALLLRQNAPRADEHYRLRLRADILTAAAQRRTITPRFTRRQMLAAGLTAATLGGAAFAVPQARAALAALLGGTPRPRTLSAPVVERSAPLPISLAANPYPWVGAENAQREYTLATLNRERWTQRQRLQTLMPVAGGIVALPGGRTLPLPAYLPDGFLWQGIMVTNATNVPYQYYAETGGGGGGSGMPWERFPAHDNTIGTYLIGGDPSDRLLILQQFRPDPSEAIIVSTFQMTVPTSVPPLRAPGTTPPPGPYGQRTTLGVIVEPARDDQIGITVQAGAGALQTTTVAGAVAWQFGGAWTADGRWHDDGTWRSLVWSRDGYLYCLSADQLPVAELLRVAESLPALP